MRQLEQNGPEEEAIRAFLAQRRRGENTMNTSEGFDLSDPRRADMEALSSGKFSLTKMFATEPESGDEFHVYIGPENGEGQTEIHMMRECAAEIRKIMAMQNNTAAS